MHTTQTTWKPSYMTFMHTVHEYVYISSWTGVCVYGKNRGRYGEQEGVIETDIQTDQEWDVKMPAVTHLYKHYVLCKRVL